MGGDQFRLFQFTENKVKAETWGSRLIIVFYLLIVLGVLNFIISTYEVFFIAFGL